MRPILRSGEDVLEEPTEGGFIPGNLFHPLYSLHCHRYLVDILISYAST